MWQTILLGALLGVAAAVGVMVLTMRVLTGGVLQTTEE